MDSNEFNFDNKNVIDLTEVVEDDIVEINIQRQLKPINADVFLDRLDYITNYYNCEKYIEKSVQDMKKILNDKKRIAKLNLTNLEGTINNLVEIWDKSEVILTETKYMFNLLYKKNNGSTVQETYVKLATEGLEVTTNFNKELIKIGIFEAIETVELMVLTDGQFKNNIIERLSDFIITFNEMISDSKSKVRRNKVEFERNLGIYIAMKLLFSEVVN